MNEGSNSETVRDNAITSRILCDAVLASCLERHRISGPWPDRFDLFKAEADMPYLDSLSIFNLIDSLLNLEEVEVSQLAFVLDTTAMCFLQAAHWASKISVCLRQSPTIINQEHTQTQVSFGAKTLIPPIILPLLRLDTCVIFPNIFQV